MRSKIKIILLVVLVLLVSFLIVNISQAALIRCGDIQYDPQGKIKVDPVTGKPAGECTLPNLLTVVFRLINILLGLSWLVAFFFIFWAGFSMVIAYGNEEKLKAARTGLTQAVIGFFLILLAFALINTLIALIGGYSLDPNAPNSIFKFLPTPPPDPSPTPTP